MRKSRNYYIIIIRAFLIGVFLILWEWSARAGLYNALFTSYPSEIFRDLIKHALITLREAFAGLLYGTIVGIALGLILGQFEILGKIFLPIISCSEKTCPI